MSRNSSDTHLDCDSFDAIASLVCQESGINLVPEKASLIQSRLRHRLRALALADFKEYAALVCSETGKFERREMISALTTNVSHFFREKHHFDILVHELMPRLINDVRHGKKFRVWSAGCSNGQEAYSIAMSLLEHFPDLSDLDFRVLATDIDPQVVSFGKKGNYSESLVSGVPKPFLDKYFTRVLSEGENRFQVSAALKSVVTFKELNLIADWPMRQPMDAIFCRNVVIYFGDNTQNNLWPRFHQHLEEHGLLFLGHSERIVQPNGLGFANYGPTTYRPVTPKTLHPKQRTQNVFEGQNSNYGR